MIDLRPFLDDIKEIEPGETRRFNHDDCPAGQDTRRRLYVTRPEATPDKTVAYCHNCQGSATNGGSKWEPYRDRKHGGPTDAVTITDDVDLPTGIVDDLHSWTTDALAWVIKNHLDQEDIRRYNIGLDPSTNRICLPRYKVMCTATKTVADLMGYQLRKIEDKRGPKYLTALTSEDTGFTKIYTVAPGSTIHKIVLVEDLVSGIHIANACASAEYGVCVVVNYGVKVNLQALDAMRSHNCSQYIWLDNDSEHVRSQAETMVRTLGMLSTYPSGGIRTLSDPKHYNSLEIREALDG